MQANGLIKIIMEWPLFAIATKEQKHSEMRERECYLMHTITHSYTIPCYKDT